MPDFFNKGGAMRRQMILRIFGLTVFLMLLPVCLFFLCRESSGEPGTFYKADLSSPVTCHTGKGVSFLPGRSKIRQAFCSPVFALEPKKNPEKIWQNTDMTDDGDNSAGKKITRKELMKRIAGNLYNLPDSDRRVAFREFEGYFDDLLKKTDGRNWKDTGKEIRDFIIQSEILQNWYIKYLSEKIFTMKNTFQRKAMIMGGSQEDDRRCYPSLSESFTLKLFGLYNARLIKTLSRDEKILFFSGNFTYYDFVKYYEINHTSSERYWVFARENENIRRQIVNTVFDIAARTDDNAILKLIIRQYAVGSLLQTPFDFDRYISLLEHIRDREPGNKVILQKLRIARFKKDKYGHGNRALLKLEKDRKSLKKEDDFDLCSNLNDKYIRRHPESWFCRGAVEYIKVRGGEYYSYRPLKYMESEDQFNPTEEIPGWNRWLQEFCDHPSEDDALYRLGRCYEIEGDYDRAIRCFVDILKTPDDSWSFDAACRIVYILDVEMTTDDFEGYMANYPDNIIMPEVLYSYGVCLMREGYYEKAVSVLNELRDNYSLSNDDIFIFANFRYVEDSIEGKLSKQIADCRTLARLQRLIDNAKTPRQKADFLYKKGQFLYYRFLTFYNKLWNGNRIWYYFFVHGIHYDDEAPMTTTRIRRENLERRFYEKFYNRMQSISVFKQIPEIDPRYPDMDKVYYSIAMEYANFDGYQDNAEKYIDWQYGRAKYLEKLLKEFPESSLADEAVYAYPDEHWHKKHKISREDYIMRRYPLSDLGKKLLVERNISRDTETDTIRYHIRKMVSADMVKDMLMECLKSGIGIPGDY